jgi:hypothetical protein
MKEKLKKIEDYLMDYWANDLARWGMFARQHSFLLLQHQSTNVIEGYHRHQVCERRICSRPGRSTRRFDKKNILKQRS